MVNGEQSAESAVLRPGSGPGAWNAACVTFSMRC